MFLALFLILIARPLSVLIAAPIILATLPWSASFPNGGYYFNLVFFVVLISVAVQGMSIPWVARKLEVIQPLEEEAGPGVLLGILPNGFIRIEMEVRPGSKAEKRRLVDLSLPKGVLLTSLERDARYLIPKDDTVPDRRIKI